MPAPQTIRPPFALSNGNRLLVATQSEKEFLAGFEEQFWALMHSERNRLIVDLTHTDGLDLTAYQMIALNLFEIGNRGKKLVLRVPESLEKYFRQSKLYRAAEVEVVHILGKTRPQQPAGGESAAAAAAIENSEVSQAMAQMQDASVAEADRKQAAEAARASLNAAVSAIAGDQAPAGGAPAAAVSPGAAAAPAGDSAEQVPIDLIRRIGRGFLVDVRTNERVPLPERSNEEFSIGRTPGNGLQIASPLVSRKHSIILREGDRYMITDLGSGNGTYVNGLRIDGNVARPLFHGFRVVLAVTRQYPNGAKAYVFHQDEV